MSEDVDLAAMSAEIQFPTKEGNVHSDLGTSDPKTWDSPAFRQTLHDALDEFLSRTKGGGFFYVGNVIDIMEEFKVVGANV